MTKAVPCECGDHCFMILGKGYVTIFDPEDAHLTLSGSFWVRIVNKHTVYAIHRRYIGIGQVKNFRFHREIMKTPPDVQVDHRFGNGMDNRKRHLRIATSSQNQCNKHPRENCSSKYMGVSRYGSKWRAVIQSDKIVTQIGTFENEVDAAAAYDENAIRLHGEFARLNFQKEKIAASG
jgi:hypothetical protein